MARRNGTDLVEPMRGEILGVERLEQLVAELARPPAQRGARFKEVVPLPARLPIYAETLTSVYNATALAARMGRPVSFAAEWILDNFHVIQEQLREAKEDLPKRYYNELPKEAEGEFAGLPRVYAIAVTVVTHTDGRVEMETLARVVRAYQAVTPLTIGELWAVPIALRFALLENLGRLAVRVDNSRREIESADALMDLLVEVSERGPDAVLATIRSRTARRESASTTTFAVEMLQRLRDHDPALDPAVEWLEKRLESQGISVEEALYAERQSQSSYQVSVGNAVGSMRTITATDWSEFFESLSLVDVALALDPSGDYLRMDFATRDRYRKAIEALARRANRPETELAELAVKRARDAGKSDERRNHVGYHLLMPGRAELERELNVTLPVAEKFRRTLVRWPMTFYVGLILSFTIAICALLLWAATWAGGSSWTLMVAFALVVLPVIDLSVSFANYIVTQLLPPRVLPKLDLSDGIPSQLKTLVVVPTLLPSEEDALQTIADLEVRYLANQDPNLHFAIASDFTDAKEATTEADEAIVSAASHAIRSLDARYGGGRFFLFHRRRLFNESDGVWMGWERKRGKLEEMNRLLLGHGSTSFSHVVGDMDALRGLKYVITLDSDTSLPRDSARHLVGAMGHPLNRPRIDPVERRVVEGYGVVQPRVSVALDAFSKSNFSRTFSGYRGVDPYTTAVSDLYQDLFGEASYVGKGIYDLEAFDQVLEGRVPENTLLSHDHFEGSYARTALATDVELFDDFPSRYDVFSKRKHRWIRGDWQVLPWLLPRVPEAQGRARNVLPGVARWKIFDNLRRSLVAPAVLLLLFASWTLLPGPPALWTLAAVLIVAFPVYVHLLTAVMISHRRPMLSSYFRTIREDIDTDTLRTMLALAFLPHQAWLTLDAIARVAWRAFVTRKQMLQWTAAAQVERRASGKSFGDTYREMWPTPAAALLAAGTAATLRPESLVVAAPFVVAWLVAPLLAHTLSRPTKVVPILLGESDEQFLRLAARRTWRFFEQFLTEIDNWLPPDNYQEEPDPVVAHRTSPTNVGLALLSNITARDLGYVGLLECTERIELTLASMNELERFRGHLYNWYDTRTRAPLTPRYVSTVDSGNLAGSLLALKQACLEVFDKPLRSEPVVEGLYDSFALFEEESKTLPTQPARETQALREALGSTPKSLGEFVSWLALLLLRAADVAEEATALAASRGGAPSIDLIYWSDAMVRQTESHSRDVQTFAPWAPLLVTPPSFVPSELLQELNAEELMSDWPSLDELSERAAHLLESISEVAATRDLSEDVRAWLEVLADAAARGERDATECMARLSKIAYDLGTIVDEMDFRFLLDDRRMLFSIGYSVETSRLDASYYDLLASESRLGSFIAVAKGDVPVEHWHRLGRSFVPTKDDRSLVSWSGSMFEYLMPTLMMHNYEGTLLHRACRSAVREQIAYGRAESVPWGVSEAAYNARDLQRNYQYGPFGVPTLGLKRGLREQLVIAPYATVLALTVDPRAAVMNLRRLSKLGYAGRYGYYESGDYTPGRIPDDKDFALIRAYMVHHQGMSLIALGEHITHGAMKRRFHAEPIVVAHDALLQERDPSTVKAIESRQSPEFEQRRTREESTDVVRYFETTQRSTPRVHLLSNGSYSLMVTTAGGGYSRRGNLAMTRWREDVTRDAMGQFCYLRDTGTGRIWSSTFQPTLVSPKSSVAVFALDKAQFKRNDGEIETETSIWVSTEDDAEVRCVRVSNLGATTREIELTSYAEIVLAPQNADVAHQAFSNLFVQTEFVAANGGLLATRRRRSATDPEVWGIHVSAVEGAVVGHVQYETDRARFIGRGRTLRSPSAVADDRPLTDTAGAVLDPIFSLRRCVRLGPGEEARVFFTTAYAGSREHATFLADKYRDVAVASRASELAWTNAQVELRHLGIAPEEAQTFLRLASRLIYSDPGLRARPDVIARNRRSQSGLWAYGISGDLPIALLRVSAPEHIPLVRQLLRAHELWRSRGLASDVVVLNEHPSSYQQELQDTLLAVARAGPGASLVDKPGGIFVRRADLMPEEDRTLLLTVARVVLVGGRGTLAQQIERKPRELNLPPQLERRPSGARFDSAPPAIPSTEFFNGHGGFVDGGKEYAIVLREEMSTPAPWTNVVANEKFGFLVTESGSGYTWSENSRENRLTTWSNDPVTDPASEAIYVRDDDTGRFWTPTPGPMRPAGRFVVRHGQGYTVFEGSNEGIASELSLFVPTEDSVKVAALRLENKSGKRRRLSVMFYSDLVLGVQRETSAPFIVTEVDAESGALTATNSYNNEFAGRVAFAHSIPSPSALTAERKEFIGRNGTLERPNALARTTLSGQVGTGLDPCFALQVNVELRENETREVTFLLGEGADITDARRLVASYRSDESRRTALDEAKASWDGTLSTLQVKTPDRAFDILVNRWLLYQTLCCRVWARAAFYQSGGAYGFRDQLQDVAACVYARPDVARQHLLRAAARQFVEGDVQHWWHPPTGRGVRTKFSDDLLWLPLVAMHYAEVTGDSAVFDEVVGFIEARELGEGEDEAYLVPEVSEESATLYEHCVRAIERSLAVGEHGIPLMGSGDWNDGMNRVGPEGTGESVWLAWFLINILRKFMTVAEARGDKANAKKYEEHAAKVTASVEKNAWDGEWYIRAFFDDGSPLGSSRNDECRIDSIAQSWGVISGAGDPHRSARAMASVEDQLVRRGDGLVMLFTPPFDRSAKDPGYIKGYLPGVRENGGQYTHAAIWVVLAYALLGDGDKAGELFALLNPVNHTATRAGIHRYKAEPYVAAADVYAISPHTGRGGWTWYTGSASWMYRVAVESILGFTKRGTRLSMDPCIARSWPGFTVEYRYGSSKYTIAVENEGGVCRGVTSVSIDGVESSDKWIDLVDDGRSRSVRVVLGTE